MQTRIKPGMMLPVTDDLPQTKTAHIVSNGNEWVKNAQNNVYNEYVPNRLGHLHAKAAPGEQ